MTLQWNNNQACIAIIKVAQDYDPLIASTAKAGGSYLQSRKRVDLLFKVAGDGYWDWYLPTANVFFSPGWKQIPGYSADEIEPSFKSWINLIQPDDLSEDDLVEQADRAMYASERQWPKSNQLSCRRCNDS